MTVYVYGASDDLIEIEGSLVEEFNYPGLVGDPPYYLAFSDGTLLKITYDGEWNIKVVEGQAYVYPVNHRDDSRRLVADWPDEIPDYSDVAVLHSDVTWVVGGTDVVK